MLYNQGQTTLSHLVALLHAFGPAISEREVQRCLTDYHDAFLEEARDVLRAGLQGSRWIVADDTGARRQPKNGFFYPDLQRGLHLVRDVVIEEPAELS